MAESLGLSIWEKSPAIIKNGGGDRHSCNVSLMRQKDSSGLFLCQMHHLINLVPGAGPGGMRFS